MTTRHVLIADNNKTLRALLADHLQRQKPTYQITEANDGYAALSHLQHQLFDLLIIGEDVSGVNALEVARMAQKFAPQIQIILLTQTDASNMRDKARRHHLNLKACFSKALLLMQLLEVDSRAPNKYNSHFDEFLASWSGPD